MVQEGSVPVPVDKAVEPVGVRPEVGVVIPPQLFEIGGRTITESWYTLKDNGGNVCCSALEKKNGCLLQGVSG